MEMVISHKQSQAQRGIMTERLEPKHDWVLLRKHDVEDRTAGGIIMAKPGEYDSLKTDRERRDHRPDREIEKNKSRGTFRGEVLAVGPGNYVDVADDLHDDVFLRKPMCCKPGDVILAQEGPVPIIVDGEILYMCHDFLILAVIRNSDEGKELIDPQHDYIFCREADGTQQSKGGIHLVTQTDHTGNKALPDRWTALGVGDGPWALRQEKSKIPEFARRPMCVSQGDEFSFEGAGFRVSAAGAQMCVVQNYQVAAVFHRAEA